MFTVYIVNNFIYFVKGFDAKNKYFYLLLRPVRICTVSDTLRAPQRLGTVPISPACLVSGCAGALVSTGGVYSRRPAPPGQPFNHRKNKKGSKNHPTSYHQLQKFPAKTKRPLQRVCVLCYTCLTSLEREESVMNQKNDKNL